VHEKTIRHRTSSATHWEELRRCQTSPGRKRLRRLAEGKKNASGANQAGVARGSDWNSAER
jgi:hypothetical protein